VFRTRFCTECLPSTFFFLALVIAASCGVLTLNLNRLKVQVFARSTDAHGTLVQAYHSPASFVESIVQPDAKEALRRKDAIILRRNAELAELWDEIKTQFPWKKAEAAFTKDAHRDDSEPEDGPASRLTALILVFSVRE
jgi:hypothetical protein